MDKPIKVVHLLVTKKWIYVVPVFSDNGMMYIEVPPVSKIPGMTKLLLDDEELSLHVREKAEISERLSQTAMPLQWDGENENAWLECIIHVAIFWYANKVLVEKSVPVITDDWHLPAFEPEEQLVLPAKIGYKELSIAVMQKFLMPKN